jgi:hypothetical protein
MINEIEKCPKEDKIKGCNTYANFVPKVPQISINFILSTFDCEEIKHLCTQKGHV